VTAGDPKVTLDLAQSHGLTAEEYDRIIRRLGREPTFTELGLFSALWSEHCAYKHSRVFLRGLPTTGPAVLQGRERGHRGPAATRATFKIEPQPPVVHRALQGGDRGGRHPADIFTMGAGRSRCSTPRFGDPADPRRLIEGVVSASAGTATASVPTWG
jgi:phosphoribosylformylglycinamidine synthase